MIRRLWVIVCDPCRTEAPDARRDTSRGARIAARRAGYRRGADNLDRCPACLANPTNAAPAALAEQAAR